MKTCWCNEKQKQGPTPNIGCWSQGATEAEALDNIKDAIREYLAVVDEKLKGSDFREVEVGV